MFKNKEIFNELLKLFEDKRVAINRGIFYTFLKNVFKETKNEKKTQQT